MRCVMPTALLLAHILTALSGEAAESPAPLNKDNGYRGIWFTLGQMSEYGDKYSGGLGTYTCSHVPIAIYAEPVRKTFFVYGGGKEGKRHLLAMASYYDHDRGTVPRPTIVHDKQGVNDPHDNPSLAVDGTGHLWVFVSGRARSRPGFVYRSLKPYDVEAFERIAEREFTYPQPSWIDGQGFVFLFTKYTKGRELYFSRSGDGRNWTPDRKLAGMGGHYQISGARQGRVITAFNWHPGGNVDRRTNLYFAESKDLGETWQSVDGRTVKLPLSEPANPALVRDYAAEQRLVYLLDIQFDAEDHPLISYVTSASWMPGPKGDPRIWTVARWTGRSWLFSEVTKSDHNYDHGSLYVEADGTWRIIGPTETGPQRWGTGGEMAAWISRDQGQKWTKVRDVTRGSQFNHAYARRPLNAQADFYALWADGDPDKFSPSRLYFCNRDGDQVWQLPYDMSGEHEKPLRVKP